MQETHLLPGFAGRDSAEVPYSQPGRGVKTVGEGRVRREVVLSSCQKSQVAEDGARLSLRRSRRPHGAW